jgi:diketogulonate reductase-like aldo/keto reductase
MAQRIPQLETLRLFYGTAWKEERTRDLVLAALTAGFRAIDTANQRKHYHEAGVGEGLAAAFAAGVVARPELFVQTKFTYVRGQDHRLPYDARAPVRQQVEQSVVSSLEHLGVGWLDSLVLHGPELSEGISRVDRDAWESMEAQRDAGRVRWLGVSNVSAQQLATLCATATTRPTFVQNRCYASRGWDRATRRVCAEHGVIYQGFSLLTANRAVVESAEVAAIARRTGKSAEQVVLRFAQQLDMVPLTGTSDPRHMADDLALGELALERGELAQLEALAG